MTDLNAYDKLAALDWALAKAREAVNTDPIVQLMHVPALQQLRDEAQAEVRGG